MIANAIKASPQEPILLPANEPAKTLLHAGLGTPEIVVITTVLLAALGLIGLLGFTLIR